MSRSKIAALLVLTLGVAFAQACADSTAPSATTLHQQCTPEGTGSSTHC